MARPRKNATQNEVNTENTANTSVVETNKTEKGNKVENPETKVTMEITDDEEVNVVALTTNVTYFDKATDDTYKWEKAGDVISVPFKVIKNMWRNHKGYLRNFCLKPLDNRVVDKLNLNKLYEDYDFLNDAEQYTVENLDKILGAIDRGNIPFKTSICNNIKTMIVNGKINNVRVITTLGKKFDVDFVSLL